MKRRLIEIYIVRAVTPYIALATLVLTAALLAQQAGKFAELLAGAQSPFEIAGRLFIGLIPNILIFTLPTATLLGVIIGFSRLSSDSEITALRAAGIGTWRLIAPALFIGVLVSILTFVIGFQTAPGAAHMLREEALNVVLYKLQTPLEPRTFSTDFPNKVIYVRDGDEARGEWGRVFIFSQDGSDNVDLYTARNGRIDITEERSELVLTDASILSLPASARESKTKIGKGTDRLTSDHSTQLRVRLNTNRSEIVSKARARQLELDELDWNELKTRSESSEPSMRRAGRVAIHKRMTLCIAPLVFTLLGSGLGALTRRGGRGAGILLGLAASLTYYLVALAGEQLAKSGTLPPYACWSGVILALAGGLLALHSYKRGYGVRQRLINIANQIENAFSFKSDNKSDKTKSLLMQRPRHVRRIWLPAGLLDRQVIRSLTWNFALAFGGLVGLVLIFTLFELLRYIAMTGAGLKLVGRYLLFLTPMIGVTITPLAMLVAGMATYAVLVRQSEAVAWLASGQSLYRLTIPGFLFALLLCGGIWLTEEKVLPTSNRIQDTLRRQIRGDAARAITNSGRQWLATNDGRRLYSYDGLDGTGAEEMKSENGSASTLKHPAVYEFDDEGVFLRRIIVGEVGTWLNNGTALQLDAVRSINLSDTGQINIETRMEWTVTAANERPEDFKQVLNNVSHLDTRRLREMAVLLNRRRASGDANIYILAFQRRFADIAAPLVMTLVSIPLAFAFGKRGTLVALTAAVLVGLGFWAASSGFNQLGLYQLAPPTLAAWAAPSIFAAIGVYLFARIRT